MIQGIGTDIIEIARIREAIRKHGQRLLDRLFTLAEQEYCARYADPAPHYAGRFAAKEAIIKALSEGVKEIAWSEMEIINDKNGKPVVSFSLNLLQNYPSMEIFLSISHCHDYATATALAFKKSEI